MSQDNSSPGIVGYVPNHYIAVGSNLSPFVINGIAPNTAGYVLTDNGTGADPSFQPPAFTGTVTSVSGTTNRITVTPSSPNPTVDISANYVGQPSITTLGTITTGTWNAGVISPTFGGTGVNNGVKTITLGGNLTTSGAFNSTFTMTGTTNVTFPTSGTLSTSTGTVTSVTGTANQVAVANGTTTPVISLIGPYTPTTFTTSGILLGQGTSSITALSPTATTGQILQNNNAANPSWSTATYPSTTTANQILFSSSANTVGGSTNLTFNSGTNTLTAPNIVGSTSITGGTLSVTTSSHSGNALFRGPSPYADIVAYGADPTGVASSVSAINAAIAALGTGGIVWVPIGTYKIDSPIVVNTAHIRFCGASRTDSIFNNTTTTSDTIQLNTFYGGVENISFTCATNTMTAGYAINIGTGATYSYVWRCDIYNHYKGILLNANLSYVDDIGCRTFSNAATGGSCVEVSANQNVWIRKLTTNNGATITGFAGVRFILVSAALVTDCQLIGATTCMSIEPTVGLTTPSIEVINTFFDTATIGLSVSGAGTPARCKFTNCWFGSQTTAGIQFNNTNMSGFTFVNCDIYGNGIGINALAATDWSICNSRIAGNTTAGIQTTAAANHSFQILGNTIGPTAVFGANGNGINIQAGTYAPYRIKDNIGLNSNTTPGITDNGVVTGLNQKEISDNLGALIKGGIASSTSASAAINTAETIIAGGNAVLGTSAVIPANSLSIGTIIRITALGTCTSTVANVSTFTLRMGTAGTVADASVATATVTAAASGTTIGFKVELLFTVRTLGATGTIAGSLQVANTGVTGISINNSNVIPLTATATLNTTTANYIELTYKSAAATTTCTFQNGMVEIVKP